MRFKNLASPGLAVLCLAIGPHGGAVAAPAAPAGAPAQGPEAAVAWGPALKAAGDAVAAMVASTPNDAALQALFDPSFLAAVPPEKLRAIFAQYAEQGGQARVLSQKAHPQGAATGARFQLRFAKGFECHMDVVLNPNRPHRIAGLMLGALTPAIADWKSLESALKALPGRAGFAAWRLPDPALPARQAPQVLGSLRSEEAFGIGSAFKLAIFSALLAEVQTKRRNWEDVLHLQEGLKSLPGGRLQDWPNESPITLASLAGAMISESDNTATDLLLHALGRARVEREQKQVLGWRFAERNLPFLSTRELFVLKNESSLALRSQYLAARPAERRALLDGPVAQGKLEGFEFAGGGKPVAIDQLEWFASPSDLAGTMHRLARATQEGDLARGLLAINPGVPQEGDAWAYMGFKGGSEPGVLNLTWLLKRQDGAWFALSMAWNREDAPVELNTLVGMANAAFKLLEAEAR